MSRVYSIALLFIISILISSFVWKEESAVQDQEDWTSEVKWYTWEEAVEANETEPKKIFVDVYTDWCHWCKVMDKKTFNKENVAEYLNTNFYPVKLNAEQKEEINFNGQVFKWVAGGRRGVHTLAYSLLEGKMSYPTVVYLNEKFERIMISPGYKDPNAFMTELKYAKEEHYKNVAWEEFRKKK